MKTNLMRIQTGLLFFCLFLFSSAFANSETKAIEQAYYSWCSAIGTAKGDAKVITAFYAPDAVLLPTLSSEILLNHRGEMDHYFVVLTNKPNIHCKTNALATRVEGDVAINSGRYTFSYTDKGHMKSIPARFSFVYKKYGDNWLIINHHSSKLPE